MAKRAKKAVSKNHKNFSQGVLEPSGTLWQKVMRVVRRFMLGGIALFLSLVILFIFVPPPGNIYQLQEAIRLGGVSRDWVSWKSISPFMAKAVVAAEDANFCQHWGFDMVAIRKAIAAGGHRGASTITQQVVKNVFLWQGRSWPRKAAEALLTPFVELFWSKQRILEVYLNVAEFGSGIFGVEAAAQHYFNKTAGDLSAHQSALLAATLPAPKKRNPARPSRFLLERSKSIVSGMATITADGRDKCFLK